MLSSTAMPFSPSSSPSLAEGGGGGSGGSVALASSSASSAPSTGVPGLPFPAHPASAHPLQSQPNQVPLRLLVAAFCKRTQDHLHDLLEQLEQEAGERARRAALFGFFRTAQMALLRLHALCGFLEQHGEEMDRLGAMNDVLLKRQFQMQTAVDVLKVASRHVDAQLTPAHDVATAMHVLSTGDYRLLPRIVERVLDEEQRMDARTLQRVHQRLNSALHVRLLATQLPPDLTAIDVEDGMARLVTPACTASVSLRMMPRGDGDLGEEERIKWRLFALEWRMRGDAENEAVLVGDAHTAHLIAHLNALMHSSATPLLVLHHTLHAFISGVLLALLHQQAVALQSHYPAQALTVAYVPSQSLVITYWKEAQSIPHHGATVSSPDSPASSSPSVSSSLAIAIHAHRLHVTHSPPLPELEGTDALTSSLLFAIDSQSVSLPRLFSRILASHARYRIKQLQAFLARYENAGPDRGYDALHVRRQDVDDRADDDDDDEERWLDDGEDGDAERRDSESPSTERIVLRRSVLELVLVPGWLLNARVDAQSGRFMFSWAQRIRQSSRAASDGLAASLSDIASLSSLPDVLRSLRHQARLLQVEDDLMGLHLGVRIQRHAPLMWSAAVPAPQAAASSSTLYIRLLSSPLFFLLVQLNSARQPAGDDAAGVHLYFVQCEAVESPTPPPVVTAPPTAATPLKRPLLPCDVLTPIACTPLPHSTLPSSPWLAPLPSHLAPSSPPPSALSPLVTAALLSCEQRVPLALFVQQLRRHAHSGLVHHSASSLSFSIPYPPQSKADSEARVRVTVEWSPPYVESALTSSRPPSSPSAAFAAAAASSFRTTEETEAAAVRCAWTASVQQPQLLHMYRDVLKRCTPSMAASMLLAAGVALLSPQSPGVSASGGTSPALLFHYRSLSPSSLLSLHEQLLHLHLCLQLEGQVAAVSLAEKFTALEASQPGDCPPPYFFSVASCSASCLLVRYNLKDLPYGDGADDVCTVALRFRRGDLEAGHYLTTGARRQLVVSIHTAPYAFPHHDYLEWEFNHRFDVGTLLKHVYHSCLAVKVIARFMERVSEHDRRAGHHHLHFHQQVTMLLDPAMSASPPAAPGGGGSGPASSSSASASASVFLLGFAPALHTVSVLAESSTRLRFLFRRQVKTTKVDIRLLNGYAFVQDFLSADVKGREEKQQPGRVPIGGLDGYLTSWYQFCGQHEQWRRVTKWNHAALTVSVAFDKQPLAARPTDTPLISVRLADGPLSGGLSAAEVDTLTRFFRDWVCVPPYAAECMHSFLSLCSAPRHVISAVLQVLALQLRSHSPQPDALFPLRVRWFHHLNAPFDVHYDGARDALFLVLQLSDRDRDDCVYVPVAFCLASGAVGWWEMEEDVQPSNDRAQPAGPRSHRRVRRPGGGGVGAGGGGATAGPLSEARTPQPQLAERWKSLGALVEALMALTIDELVLRLASPTPLLSIEHWCGAVANGKADVVKEDAAAKSPTMTVTMMELAT